MDFEKAYKRVVQLMDKLENLPSGATGDARRNEIFEELYGILDEESAILRGKDKSYRSKPYFDELNDKLIEFNEKYNRPKY